MSDILGAVLMVIATLIGIVLSVTAVLYGAHRWDEWDDRKRDALASERCVACQSDLPLICLTIASPPFDLCDRHYKRYRSISELEREVQDE